MRWHRRGQRARGRSSNRPRNDRRSQAATAEARRPTETALLLVASACRALPLGFARQAKISAGRYPAGLCAEPLAVADCLGPRHSDDRLLRMVERGVAPERRRQRQRRRVAQEPPKSALVTWRAASRNSSTQTRCTGFSLSCPVLQPIGNHPAGMRTSAGTQSCSCARERESNSAGFMRQSARSVRTTSSILFS